MLRQQIVNKIFILDFGLVREQLDICIDEILWKHLNITNATYKARHTVEKAIINRVICKLISNTNDTPVASLLGDDMLILNIGRELDSYAQAMYVRLHIAYDKVFRFVDNVEVNVDTMVSGNNITVFTYENRLD